MSSFAIALPRSSCASTTVGDFANELGRSPESLIELLRNAGISKASSSDAITQADKSELLNFLKSQHADCDSERKKITLVKDEKTTPSPAKNFRVILVGNLGRMKIFNEDEKDSKFFNLYLDALRELASTLRGDRDFVEDHFRAACKRIADALKRLRKHAQRIEPHYCGIQPTGTLPHHRNGFFNVLKVDGRDLR